MLNGVIDESAGPQASTPHAAIREPSTPVQRNVTPVVIHCSPPTLGKGDKWWQVPCRRMHFRIEVREDIAIHPFVEAADGEAIAARRLTDYLQDYFAEENDRHVVA